ncbi:MAG: ABC transporter permease, partial [Gemmataceae bacterium]|nr:ABC transporter permease [Gemmataceae bacterium]
MSSALFGILQLDRGDPWGYAQVSGLAQSWLQDAGGFAAVGLVLYLLYALSTPTDKSESERLRVPVSQWMVLMGAISLVCYAVLVVLMILGKGAVPLPPLPGPGEAVKVPPPEFRPELQAVVLMLAGAFALLGLCEPFARDALKILRRNVSFNAQGVRRFARTLGDYSAGLLSRDRLVAIGGAFAVYLVIGGVLFVLKAEQLLSVWTWLLAVGAGVFLAALALLMLFEAEGPVWAIAKLSFREAVRKQVLWLFVLILLPFLFPAQWFSSAKDSDELRVTTSWVTFVLSFLCLVPGVLLAAFGIPDDIKSLNIFTVVSKPVERFEIVLGRFVGYVALMTLVLFGLTGVSAVLISNKPLTEKAREETYKARVPVRGKLEFRSLRAEDRSDKQEFAGTNVGREFDYRRYIAGHPDSPQRAIWKFAELPAEMQRTEGDRIPIEFTFDIFKMTKGEQDKGVLVNFTVVTHHAPQRPPLKTEKMGSWEWVSAEQKAEYDAAVARLQSGTLLDPALLNAADRDGAVEARRIADRMKSLIEKLKAHGVPVTEGAGGLVTAPPANINDPRPDTPSWKAVNALAEEFGFYEYRGKRVLDYTVMGIDIPAGLVRNANDTGKAPDKDEQGRPLPRLTIYVKCESGGQLLGAAEPDLYLLRNEMPYAYNFFKGAVGLWCRLCMFIGVAVAASTYLSGILSFLLTGLIYVVGLFTDHLNDIATGQNVGGPLRSMSQILKAEQPTAQPTDTAFTRTLLYGDKALAWMYRRIQNVIPDIDSFSWGHFVAEGFNINPEYLVV